uniref:MT-A70 family methyltransferase n=1 Tax=Ningiella ruwaisensis TaxID=2364274 RepID=UPI00109F1EE9|nr:MT-A70 family methyltransferase [Ningiella ruwaisensis]
MILRIKPEFKDLIPPLSDSEREQLEQNILSDGIIREPIVIWQGFILDGHNRYDIAHKNELRFEVHPMDFEDENEAKLWMINNQFGRRNLPPFVRAELALKAKPLIAERAKENLVEAGKNNGKGLQNSAKAIDKVDTRAELSKRAEVSHDTISKAEKILEKADEDTKAKLRSGEISINAAYKEIRKADLRKNRIEKITEISKGNSILPSDKKYPLIYADPPWRYETATENRKIENQYPTMSIDEICELDVPAADNCILFMWVTTAMMEKCFDVLKSWGFKYRASAVWDKQKMGMGYFFRVQHEFLIVATKGDIPTPEPQNRFRSIFSTPSTKHSAKPEQVIEAIEKMYPELEKLEMFCRSPREGWNVWGNQSDAA